MPSLSQVPKYVKHGPSLTEFAKEVQQDISRHHRAEVDAPPRAHFSHTVSWRLEQVPEPAEAAPARDGARGVHLRRAVLRGPDGGRVHEGFEGVRFGGRLDPAGEH